MSRLAESLACLSFCIGVALTSVVPRWAQAGAMHWCPGNRFTDALSPQEARERGCRPAASGRLSQVQPLAAPKLEEPAVAVTGSADAVTAVGAPVPAAPRSPSPVTTPATTPEAVAPQVDAPRSVAAPVQAARDRDARQILEAELQRTRAAQQSLVSSAGAADPERLHRLRQDEAALRRELARLGP